MSRSPSEPNKGGLAEQIEVIEETYEFMLAYAAQGLSGMEKGGSGEQIRDSLKRCSILLENLPNFLMELVDAETLEPAEHYRSFIEVLGEDARKSHTAFRLILAQTALSSQLIDNLNGWIHLRALLTGLFVIDEILKGDLTP